ncbi:transmembrane protein 53 [Engraulis encrasicolus]|uniref:transmembrane protein 53 n=1 Tax=Engraulis encrasicolus TaxID=184585 RepID=UPI002FD25A4C
MGDDDIEYNIVFPEALVSERHWRGSKEPVVILLGWAGCRDKHLVKYSSIYTEQGCITLRYTAPLKTVFISESFGYKELRHTASKLLETLYDYEVENNPIFFHVFSNGGFMLYRYMVELLQKDKQFSTLCVLGTVVDSAPGSGNVKGALRALRTTLGPKINVLLRYLLMALFAVTVFLLRIVLYPVTKYFHKNHYDAMMDRPAPWPQLYLYSRADQVIRHADVERMVHVLQGKELAVQSFDFGTPAHVSLFRDFPEDYSRRCLNFLGSCTTSTEDTKLKRRHVVQQ